MTVAVKPLSIAILGGLLTMAGPSMADTIKLRIIETTDIHTNVMDYDYYKDKPSEQIGLTRAATLVKQAREEATNSILVDNGDLIKVAQWVTTWQRKALKLAKFTLSTKQ